MRSLTTDSNEEKQVWLATIQRDDGKCLICGRLGSVVHHIIPRSHPFAELWSLKNMVTLCNQCHRKAHENDRRARVWFFARLTHAFGYDYSTSPDFKPYVSFPT